MRFKEIENKNKIKIQWIRFALIKYLVKNYNYLLNFKLSLLNSNTTKLSFIIAQALETYLNIEKEETHHSNATTTTTTTTNGNG